MNADSSQVSEPGPTFCARCGHPNSPEAQYCEKCKAALR